MLRRSVILLVILLGVIALAGPLLGLIVQPLVAEASEVPSLHSWSELSLRTLCWSIGTALLAMLLGWLPGRMLGSCLAARRQGRLGFSWPLVMSAMLIPLLVPAYAIFYSWWQTWPADSWLFRWLVDREAIGLGRQFTLGVALVGWSWPLVSLCVAPAAASWPRSRSEQLRTDGASWWQFTVARLHHEIGGLLLGGMLVSALVFGNVICFDLAGVFTIGNELRALGAVQAGPVAMGWLALPAIVVALMAAITIWLVMRRPVDDTPVEAPPSSKRSILVFLALWMCTVVLPIVLLVMNLDLDSFDLWRQHGGAILRDLLRGLLVGVVGVIIFLGLLGLLRSTVRWNRWCGESLAMIWFAMFLFPGSLISMMVQAGIDLLPSESLQVWILSSGLAMHVGLIASLGGIAALAARWAVWSEPRDLRDLRQLHGGRWSGDGQRVCFMSLVVGLITMLLSLGEIPITMQLAPPAPSPPISVTVLNAMHYQRPETVIAVLAFLVALGAMVAIVLALLTRPWKPFGNSSSLMVMMMTLLVMFGCEQQGEVDPVLQVDAVLGGPGRSPGRFDYPRAAAIDQETGDFYVIEKGGRVQRLRSDGSPVLDWMMPRIDHGRPTGISTSPDGKVWIPDTHEHRVLIYDNQGQVLHEFGRYGTEAGEFIYPTDITFGPDDLIYISEYGGNDRIQVFNQDLEWVRTLGSPGVEVGQFQRPQSIMFTPDGEQLIVADARNRRVQSIHPVTGEARVLVQGDVVGPLQVPFGLWVQADGSMLVTDLGSHRLLKYSAAGELQSSAGGWGWGEGQLRDPWVVMQQAGQTFILDSGNSRILSVP
ncbi:MAG: hypothetical protein CMJ39_02490 [Phycisphaerae bacterium]|nr:hypothetical protein [Phycisphaerae bacterium]